MEKSWTRIIETKMLCINCCENISQRNRILPQFLNTIFLFDKELQEKYDSAISN
jgi:hypothetical protein